MIPMQFIFELLHDDAVAPTRATEGSAGYDVRAYIKGQVIKCSAADNTLIEYPLSELVTTFVLNPGMRALIPLGFKGQVEEGYEAQLRPRSGLSFKSGLRITNSPGTIDADFPDEWKAVVENTGHTPVVIEHGDRIAQVVFNKFEEAELIPGKVEPRTSRTGGFGSSGMK